MGFDYEILYKPGKSNNAADALSRRDLNEGETDELLVAEDRLAMVTNPSWELWNEIREAMLADPECLAMREKLEKDPTAIKGLTLQRDLIWIKVRVWVPNDLPLRKKILQEFHSSPSAGHSGDMRTYHRVAQMFWWEGIRSDVRNFVRECDVCQRNKADLHKPAGLLAPLPIPDDIWTDISMDFIEGLPRSGGRDTIFVVVDRLSNYAHFMTLAHPFSAKDVAQEFVKGVVKLHGIPSSIVSDRDKVFLSLFWQELFRLQGTELKTSTAYHRETDGQTEVVNRGLEQYLRCFVSSHPKLWERFLAWAEFWYNTTFHQSIKMSPFEAVYGRKPPPLVHYLPGTAAVHEVDHELRSRDEVLKELKCYLEAARNRMK